MKYFRKLSQTSGAVMVALVLAHGFINQAAAQGVTDKVVKIGAYNALTGPIPPNVSTFIAWPIAVSLLEVIVPAGKVIAVRKSTVANRLLGGGVPPLQ